MAEIELETWIEDLRCQAAGHSLSLEDLARGKGCCPQCGADRFAALFRKRVTMRADPPPERQIRDRVMREVCALHPAGAVVFGVVEHLARAMRTSVANAELRVEHIGGSDLLAILAEPPEAQARWLQDLRVETAQRSLRPGQQVCPACGGIFNVAHAGPTTKGYCSKGCLASDRGREAARQNAATVTCPACHRSVPLMGPAAGQEVRCPACLRTFRAR